MAQLLTDATSFQGFARWMDGRPRKKVSHNTYAEREDARAVHIRLHATIIVTFHRDGTITLNSGGWRTVTTKDRMNSLLPNGLRVYSQNGVWTLFNHGEVVSEFYDGMRFTPEGVMLTDVLVGQEAELRKVKRQIAQYVKLYTDEEVMRLVNEAAEKGTAGDCWFCSMRVVDGPHAGETLGQASKDTSHLVEHMDEGYTMATVMLNALIHVGYREHQLPVVVRIGSIVRRAIRRYLKQTLTLAEGARPQQGVA